MTAAYQNDVSMGGHNIKNVATPVSAQDAATKGYVDSGAGGGGTVTNVATGTGLTGGPITTTGTVSVDGTVIRTSGINAFAADQSMGSHKLTSVTDPASPQDAATKNYVDNAVQALAAKNDVNAATTTALTELSYTNNGGVGDLLTLATGVVLIDGQSLVVNNRYLIKNQGNAAHNGIWVCQTVGLLGVSAVFIRSTDFDQAVDGINGALVYVLAGTTNTNTLWSCTVAGSITWGTTNINWSQFLGSTYTADESTLHLAGTTFSIISTYAGQTSIVTVGTITAGTWAGTTIAVNHGGTGLTTLTAHAIYVGNGTSAPTALSVGATNTVLHGNTGADPSFSAIVEADISLSNNTTNNVSTSKHGFTPILPNDATRYLDGTGAYSVPAGTGGSGTVTTTGSPASGNLSKFSGATSITNGDLAGDVTTSGTLTTTLANTAVTAGSYTNTSLTVDAKGRLTAASSGAASVTTLPALVQQNVNNTSGLTASIAYKQNVTSGGLLIVCLSWEGGAATDPTITDTRSTSYTKLKSETGGASNYCVYYGAAGGSGANTVTPTWPASSPSFGNMLITEWRNVQAVTDVAAVDVSGTAPVEMSFTTSTDLDLIFLFVCSSHNSQTMAPVPPGMTLIMYGNTADSLGAAFSVQGKAGLLDMFINLSGFSAACWHVMGAFKKT